MTYLTKALSSRHEYIFTMKYTNRDKIWNAALKKDDEITPEYLAEALDVGERTVRDTLNCMEETGFLRRRGGEGRDPVRYYSVVDIE